MFSTCSTLFNEKTRVFVTFPTGFHHFSWRKPPPLRAHLMSRVGREVSAAISPRPRRLAETWDALFLGNVGRLIFKHQAFPILIRGGKHLFELDVSPFKHVSVKKSWAPPSSFHTFYFESQFRTKRINKWTKRFYVKNRRSNLFCWTYLLFYTTFAI